MAHWWVANMTINQILIKNPVKDEISKAVAATFGKKELQAGYILEDVYTYCNADHTGTYYKYRLEHKDCANYAKVIKHFRQVAAVESDAGKWRITLSNLTFELSKPSQLSGGDALYNLPNMNQDIQSAVWIVEGEKKVKYLGLRGILATTTGNATGIKQFNWQPLAGREIVIWRDNDASGLKWQDELISILQALNCIIKLVDVDALNLPVKGDCIDWLKQFRLDHNRIATFEDIQALSMVNVAKSDCIQTPTNDLNHGADASISSPLNRITVSLLCAANIEPEPISWIWNGYLAKGNYTFLPVWRVRVKQPLRLH